MMTEQLPPLFPPSDFERSPITGWTRAHWEAIADTQLLAVRRYASPELATIDLPGRASWSGTRSDGLEGYARTFLLAAFRVAGGGEDPHGHLARYRAGLIAGTDPRSAERWPEFTDRGQPLVEAASIVIGLYLTSESLWDSLSATERENVCLWLHGSTGMATPHNNWVLFAMIVQEFLARVGYDHSQPEIDRGLRALETWYAGDGWYRDGDGNNFDYYNGWAMHLYPTVWTWLARRRVPQEADEWAALFSDRLARFLEDHVGFFSADGRPVFFGRSLIYRHAVTSALWLGQLSGVSPIPAGAVRRLASGTLKYFWDGGAFGSEGILTAGWFGPFPPMVQAYSGPASPYWASKGFLGLLLPDAHPVWADVEQDADSSRSSTVIGSAGMLLSKTSTDGIVRLANHGSDHFPPLRGADDPHYGRLSYSSHTTPGYGPELVDNHLAIIDGSGRPSRRLRIHPVGLARFGGDDLTNAGAGPVALAASRHVPVWAEEAGTRWQWDGGRWSHQEPTATTDPEEAERLSDFAVATSVAVTGRFELRLHVIRSRRQRNATVREGGFALPGRGVLSSSALGACASVRSDVLQSSIHIVHGYTKSAVASAGATPMSPTSAAPVLYGMHQGTRSVFVSLVELSGASGRDEATGAATSPIRSVLVSETGEVRAEVTLSDGSFLAASIDANVVE